MRDTAIVNYHLQSTELQAFRFDVDGIVGHLASPDLAPARVRVQDIRQGSPASAFDEDSIVFDHTVRIDPLDAVRTPARKVHTDYSAAGANHRLIDSVGERRATECFEGHFRFVNVWRPVCYR